MENEGIIKIWKEADNLICEVYLSIPKPDYVPGEGALEFYAKLTVDKDTGISQYKSLFEQISDTLDMWRASVVSKLADYETLLNSLTDMKDQKLANLPK
jgi:hypothetical protein